MLPSGPVKQPRLPAAAKVAAMLILATACAARAPRTPAPDLVDITTVDPTIRLDLRYATRDNFTGVAVYPAARCLLRRDAAERLARVQRRLQAEGLGQLFVRLLTTNFEEAVAARAEKRPPVFTDDK